MLYVEDNSSNLSLMESIVDCLPNLSMISATTAETGIELATDQQPDLILMDINLPGINGIEALKQLKKIERTKHIPVFAISADAMPTAIAHGKEAGFEQYLTKPIDIPKLLAALDSVWEQ